MAGKNLTTSMVRKIHTMAVMAGKNFTAPRVSADEENKFVAVVAGKTPPPRGEEKS